MRALDKTLKVYMTHTLHCEDIHDTVVKVSEEEALMGK